ncbi:hypothetical protein MNBD_GAMMA24-657 [hydrothermal vent metagenome]|uniref:Nudix hydrolase domain-containing protein n=1 Tax=hydrothermal vent metagenome TaxID=652676 RepID=A0A3B1C4P4_9ZZZZ
MKRTGNSFSGTDVLYGQSNAGMDNLIPQIRNATRALIVRDGHILLLKKEYDDGKTCFAFPGGGQETDETLIQALNRECAEEIGVEVEIGRLIHVADCFKLRNTTPSTTRHLVEFFFECTISDSYIPRNGHHPDKHQVGVVWKDVTQVENMALFFPALIASLDRTAKTNDPVYLGKFC